MPDPIFIIGVPRSGTTALHRLLCQHPQAAWLSGWCVRYPLRPGLNRAFMVALDLPLLGPLLARRFKPWEAYDFWESHCRGFRRPFRDLTADDVTEQLCRTLPAVFNQLTSPKRQRLLLKITGWPRLGFLHRLFPQARFIHLVRDGRAVANSLINTDFWLGWQGPHNWRWGPLTPDQEARWHQTGQSFVALAGLQWEILLRASEVAAGRLPAGTLLEVRYEALCADPAGTLHQIAQFCHLPWPPPQPIGQPLHNRNNKWQQDLTPTQQQHLNQVIGDCLRDYHYE